MVFSNKDIWGVSRGRCKECNECKQYIVAASARQVKCEYCNHAPGCHNRLSEIGDEVHPERAKLDICSETGSEASSEPAPPPTASACQDQIGWEQTGFLSYLPHHMSFMAPGSSAELAHSSSSGPLPPADSDADMEGYVQSEAPAQDATPDVAVCSNSSADTNMGDVTASDSGSGDATLQSAKNSGSSASETVAGSATKNKSLKKWPPDKLPQFSHVVRPILNGSKMPEDKHKRLSRQLRDEVAMFLDENHLIEGCSKGEARWAYKRLGDALAEKYPYLQWENAPPNSKMYSKSTEVYSVFIKRLSNARKVRRHRNRNAVAVSPPTPGLTKESVSKECAMAELQALSSSPHHLSYNAERMTMLLEVTISERRQTYMDPLPKFFLHEKLLTVEAELRFGTGIPVLEKQLRDAVNEIAKTKGKDLTFVDIERMLQPDAAEFFLLNEGVIPQDITLPAPHIYLGGEKKVIFGGAVGEVITLEASSSLEKALLLCLTIYYIKNISYPLAIAQLLVLVQRLVLSKDTIPRGLMNGALKKMLANLKGRLP